MAHCEVVEPLAFLTTNQQIPGYVTDSVFLDSDIIAFDQSVMARTCRTSVFFQNLRNWVFHPYPLPRLWS